MPFTFTANNTRVFRCLEGFKGADLDVNDRIALSLDTDGDIPSAIGHMMPELVRKWGLNGMQLQSFRFDVAREGGSSLPLFHQGLSQELIDDFLNDPTVLATIRVAAPGGKAITLGEAYATAGAGVMMIAKGSTEALQCTTTTLSLLNRLLHCRSLVRNPPPVPSADEVSTTDVNKSYKYPTVRQMDVYLPCGVTISDALREYVMLPDDQYSENTVRVQDEELASVGTAPEDDDDLSEGRSYPLLSPAQRQEFLYHIFWRLVSGGSPLCQYEEDAIYYKLGSREVFKDIVCVGRRKAVEGNSRPDLVIQSHVFALRDIKVGSGKKVGIFPVLDDVSPSNSNFAYIIINPTRREIIWWYNAFSSSF